jgi:transposase
MCTDVVRGPERQAMDVVVERCGGLDVHKDTVVACVRTPGKRGRRGEEIRTFGTMTVDLLALRDWLMASGVTRVGMESTGVYWKPVFYVLEDGLECWLLNARHGGTTSGASPARNAAANDAAQTVS